MNKLYFFYGADGLAGMSVNGENYYYQKNAQNDIIGIYDSNNNPIARYTYDAWGNHTVEYCRINSETDESGVIIRTFVTYVPLEENYDYNDISNKNRFVAIHNPFRYRSYYYDYETGLYYLNSRYYDPETGRFINADSLDNIDSESINGFNLYLYCGDNPISFTDPFCTTKWWEWLISALQIVVGAILIFTGVGAGLGATLVAGGVIGLISNAVNTTVGNGLGSMANGAGAISTGISLFSYGWPGAIIGTVLIAVGVATMALGANDVVTGLTGTNYIQKWTGMSDSQYAYLNTSMNLISSIGTIAGRLGMRSSSTNTIGKYDVLKKNGQKPYARITKGRNTYYFDGRGSAYWSKHNIGLADEHYHASLGRDKDHFYSYLRLIIKLITGW